MSGTLVVSDDRDLARLSKSHLLKKKQKRAKRQLSVKKEAEEIQLLEERIKKEFSMAESTPEYSKFVDLPITRRMVNNLTEAKFTTLTKIQRLAAPIAIAGRDILGAAKTGSGKTLAFLVPLMEKLSRQRWDEEDGLGGLVISPTRELSMQIFHVFTQLAGRDGLTGALITGGRTFKEEQSYITRMNVIIGTPGRILQHLEQTPQFNTSELQVLVLDEADRILDMGFEDELNSILSYLPEHPQRQTLLFSATQTKSVKQIARLSMNDPEYVAVHEDARFATPERLEQHYAVCCLSEKLNVVWSFVKSHLKSKTIIFFSSCKQARFAFEAFRRMRPGIPLMALHGKVKQGRRMFIFNDFNVKKAAVLIATDVASRGLDFPHVDWVVQADCPEDIDTYIHRVGRTARFKDKGKALLCLLPSEESAMVDILRKNKVPIKRTAFNKARTTDICKSLQAYAASDPDFKFLAQKCFIAYVRSVYLQKNKDIFDVSVLPLKQFAAALGLPGEPQIKFLGKSGQNPAAADSLRLEAHKKKNKNHKLELLKQKIKKEKERKRELIAAGSTDLKEIENSSDDDEERQKPSRRSFKGKLDRMLARQNDGVFDAKRSKLRKGASDHKMDDDDLGGVMVLKRKASNDDEAAADVSDATSTVDKRIPKKIRIAGHGKNSKVRFDDDGNAVSLFEKLVAEKSVESNSSTFGESLEENSMAYVKKIRDRLADESKADKASQRARLQAVRVKRRGKQEEGLVQTAIVGNSEVDD